MDDHFSQIAHKYRSLRATDVAPVISIARRISMDHMVVEAIDIGCGAGRYDLLLFKYVKSKLRLTCVDSNPHMLDALGRHLTDNGISNFTSVNAKVGCIPSQDSIYDCVFTFNAVHHFNLPEFLLESARILKAGGYIFIYTRLREQNRRNIWGRYFPMFNEKETRLYSFNEFREAVEEVPNLYIESVEYYKYNRRATRAQLIDRAKSRHYSTFSLYTPGELEEAIKGFANNIKGKFTNRVHWSDENTLFVIRKKVLKCPQTC